MYSQYSNDRALVLKIRVRATPLKLKTIIFVKVKPAALSTTGDGKPVPSFFLEKYHDILRDWCCSGFWYTVDNVLWKPLPGYDKYKRCGARMVELGKLLGTVNRSR